MTITGDFTQVNGLKMGIRLNFPAWPSGLFPDIEITPGVVVKMKLDEKRRFQVTQSFPWGQMVFR